jgi:hypothetical protein
MILVEQRLTDFVPIEVKVIGSGTATPPGEKFPGAYTWRDPGLLVNIHYGPKRYVSSLFKPEEKSPTKFYFNRLLQAHPSTRANATHRKDQFPSSRKQERLLASVRKNTLPLSSKRASSC